MIAAISALWPDLAAAPEGATGEGDPDGDGGAVVDAVLLGLGDLDGLWVLWGREGRVDGVAE
jgi:hypothetical protein